MNMFILAYSACVFVQGLCLFMKYRFGWLGLAKLDKTTSTTVPRGCKIGIRSACEVVSILQVSYLLNCSSLDRYKHVQPALFLRCLLLESILDYSKY